MLTLNGIKSFMSTSASTFMIYLLFAFVLICVAYLLPKTQKSVFIERICLMSLSALLIFIPLIAGFGELGSVAILLRNNLDAYLLIAWIVVLLLGIFTEKSYLTQGLYGVMVAISLPFGLLNMLFPAWANASMVSELFSNPRSITFYLMYAMMFFIPVWMIRTGIYKVRLVSVWHVFGGLAIGGAGVIFLWETGFLSSLAVYKVLHLFNAEEPRSHMFGAFVGVIALLAGVMLLLGLGATLIRKYVFKNNERLIVSESWTTFFVRLGGRILAIGFCGGGALLIPGWMDAIEPATRLGFGASLVLLIPMLLFAAFMVGSEYLAEHLEIKYAIARARAAEMAAEAKAAAVK